MGTAIMYDASTGKEIDIIQFVEQYSQWYYFSTSRWVESEIEKILKKDKKTVEDFLNVFAWKTDRVNQQKCEEKKKYNNGLFYFTQTDREDGEKWGIKGKEAVAITRSGVIKKSTNKEEVKTLYSFLSNAVTLSSQYGRKTNGMKLEEKEKEQQKILSDLCKESVDKIGSVYLVTFLYFVTNGDAPIYDTFAMMALDAIYPGKTEQDNIKSKELGSVIPLRNLPDKKLGNKSEINPDAFAESLFKTDKYKTGENKDAFKSVYRIYIEKLKRFMNDYNTAINNLEDTPENKPLKENYPVSYANCRDIDRALWVYGHLFRNIDKDNQK